MTARKTVAAATDQVTAIISQAILSIAGSDPSGGAGIQADLKTYASLGVYGCAAISCLTVQNSTGVFKVQAVEPWLVGEQIRKVLADLPISHIKTGMIGTGGVARVIGECLADFSGTVVCDPVLKASDGHDLLLPEDGAILRGQVIARSTALTPNFEEFQWLTGLELTSDADITMAAGRLFAQHPRLEALVVKGGHRHEDQPVTIDFLYLRENMAIRTIKAERTRINSTNTHGTGCTYASALAAYHLRTGDWQQAFQLAGDYVAKLLKLSAAAKMGNGTGPLWHHLFNEEKFR